MKRKLEKRDRVQLAAVRRQFERWRAVRKGSAPIPDQLWAAAAGLVGAVPITVVSRELGLEFPKLKAKIKEHAKRPTPARRTGARVPRFLELNAADAIAPTHTPAAAWLEVQRPDGALLRLHPEAVRELDIGAFLQGFCSAKG